MKKLIMCVLLTVCTTSFALTPASNVNGVTIKNQNSVAAKNNKNLIKNLYHWIALACKKPSLITSKNMNKYFDKNVRYMVNGKLLVSNSAGLKQRFLNITKNVKKIRVKLPLKHVIATDNYVTFNYKVKITKKSKLKYTDEITVIARIDNQKITSWQAIAAHKG